MTTFYRGPIGKKRNGQIYSTFQWSGSEWIGRFLGPWIRIWIHTEETLGIKRYLLVPRKKKTPYPKTTIDLSDCQENKVSSSLGVENELHTYVPNWRFNGAKRDKIKWAEVRALSRKGPSLLQNMVRAYPTLAQLVVMLQCWAYLFHRNFPNTAAYKSDHPRWEKQHDSRPMDSERCPVLCNFSPCAHNHFVPEVG